MTQAQFDKLLNARIAKIKATMSAKSKEYSPGADKLHNFKRTARMNDITPSRALQGMLSKHLTSYMDILDTLDRGVPVPQTVIDEKIGDILNYFVLQEAVITEMNQELTD